MKYLKLFESIEISENDKAKELEEIIRDSLAYLIDKGVKIHVFSKYANFLKTLEVNINCGGLQWSSISDDIIPLLLVLNDNYYFGRISHSNNRATNSVPNISISSCSYNYFDITKDREVTKSIRAVTTIKLSLVKK